VLLDVRAGLTSPFFSTGKLCFVSELRAYDISLKKRAP
jgi:hypothetical protein